MNSKFLFRRGKPTRLTRFLVATTWLSMVLFPVTPAMAQNVITTVVQPTELPVEIEVELGPGGLKQAPLWKELIQLLKDPYLAPVVGSGPDGFGSAPSAVVRRPGFGVTMPALNVWPLGYNYLIAEPLRLRTSDGELSADQPGPLFDPDQVVEVNEFNVPTELRSVIGALVACNNNNPPQPVETFYRQGGPCDGAPPGSLVVSNPNGRGVRRNLGFTGTAPDPRIPPHRTVVAVAAVFPPGDPAGRLQELDGVSTSATVELVPPLEIPINEEDFFREDPTGVPAALTAAQPGYPTGYVGRLGAEVLGKALFWDMQVGSDSVQSCGTCHFSAGADTRTKNQLNPNHLADPPDLTLQVKGPNQDVVAADFPFRRLANLNGMSEGPEASTVVRDFNDVMSSMGVISFKQFVDVPVGAAAFGTPSAIGGVASLLPDIGLAVPDPIPVFQGLRRVEPRNTPTMHSAAFNFDNFWDGRARFHFNGGSVFGHSDPQNHIFLNTAVGLVGATNGDIRPELIAAGDEKADQPVRIKFSSLASQAVGPPLSDFEMSFAGRNWQKIGKKLLQSGVTPLANQLVAVDDSRLGPFSNQGGALCPTGTALGKPGLCITYGELIQLAFRADLWNATDEFLQGAPDPNDPFDGYSVTITGGNADSNLTDQFTQAEANFSLFFALAVQSYEELLIPDNTPFDQFMDANPLAANGIGQPGEQRVLFPTLIPGLVTTPGACPAGTTRIGGLCFPAGFGPEELQGFDFFAAGNLTAALPAGHPQNLTGYGSNPFTRHARCSLCHAGPEQTDHTINFSHGLLKGDAEFEFPAPPLTGIVFTGTDGTQIVIPTPEPPGPIAVVAGLALAEELGETAQDVVELEPRDMAPFNTDPDKPWDRIVAAPSGFAFGDQGIYNVGLRPVSDDIGRGGNDPWGWPLSMSAMTMKNIGGPDFVPCDLPGDNCVMDVVDPAEIGFGLFEETGGGVPFPGTALTLQSINPGLDKTPIEALMPAYIAPWLSDLPAGEIHPLLDEMGFMVNTLTPPNGGPALEFTENLSATDLHCGTFDPATFGPVTQSPNFGWGAVDPITLLPVLGACANNQSGVPGNMGLENTAATNDAPPHGSWPTPNRVGRLGAFKAPQLRNVELTGPYFHTGSYLTLRQVVDFYMRAGDFPATNGVLRDQHIVDIEEQAFGFGTTRIASNGGPIPDVPFADALPDTAFQFDPMPDTAHNLTPEFVTQEQAKVALVKFLLALTDDRVRFERAPFDRPQLFVPIDGTAPENTLGSGTGVVAPATPPAGTLAALATCSVTTPCPLPGPDGIFGTADDIAANNAGPDGLFGTADDLLPGLGPDGIAGTADDIVAGITAPLFRQLAAVGAAGNATPVPAFLGVTNNPAADCVTEISHFCR